MTRILVIGAKGQLGQSFQYWAPHYPNFEFLFKDLPELNILNKEHLEEYFKKTPVSYVINCAAYTAVDQAEDHPDEAQGLNVNAIDSLCVLSIQFGFKLIHFSTDYVFDGAKNSSYAEDDRPRPTGIYGKTKARGESVMLKSGIDGWIIRTSWLFSPYGKNFVKIIFFLLQNKDEINVVADQTGSPTYALDLAAATLKVLDKCPLFDGVKVYHYTNSGHTTWYGLAKAIQSQVDTNCKIHPVNTAEYLSKAPRPKYSVLSCEKTINEFNLNLNSWELALKDCLNKLKKL